MEVYAADNFGPLVTFWQCLKENPSKLVRYCKRLIPQTKTDYNELNTKMHNNKKYSNFYRAAAFYNAIRTSYGGILYASFMSNKVPILERAISTIPDLDLRRMRVVNKSFDEFIPHHMDKWMYVDPPYYYNYKYYGTNSGTSLDPMAFDHVKLRDLLQKHPSWMLSYNDCSYIRNLYQGHVIRNINIPYSITHAKHPEEIVIFSKGYVFPANALTFATSP